MVLDKLLDFMEAHVRLEVERAMHEAALKRDREIFLEGLHSREDTAAAVQRITDGVAHMQRIRMEAHQTRWDFLRAIGAEKEEAHADNMGVNR